MPEHKELAAWPCAAGFPDHTQMIAPACPFTNVNHSSAELPLFCQEATAAVGWSFLRAGRFEKCELAQQVQHLRQARLESRQKGFRNSIFGHRTWDGSNSNKCRQRLSGSKDARKIGCGRPGDCL